MTISKEQLINIGAENLADIIISIYQNNKDMHKQIDIILAGAVGDPKKIISMIKKEIAALKKGTRFIDYYESNHFADRLDKLRLHIANDLMLASPVYSAELMINFINLHESILNRVDDSNGEISSVFVLACSDLGKIYQHISYKTEEAIDLVFSWFMSNKFGVLDDIIQDFKSVLKLDGLEILQNKIENSLNDKNAMTVTRGLKEIADCKKDVDAFIRACSFTSKPCAHDHLEIAKRLIDAWRSEEALNWLASMELASDHSWHQDRIKLKIQALELSGEYQEAQNERIAWFEKSLSSEIYGQILSNAKDEFKEDFRKKSIAKAFDYFHPSASLSFLKDIQEFNEVAKFVLRKIDELNGDQYYTLRPVADLLREIDPLAATLVYRKLIEPILEKAKSKYYNYAAKDLLTCKILSTKIIDWQNFQDHESYQELVEEKNKRKLAFWGEYKSAIQKQEAKQLAKKDKDDK